MQRLDPHPTSSSRRPGPFLPESSLLIPRSLLAEPLTEATGDDVSGPREAAGYPPAVSATPALLVAAAGVAVGHAVLPDHWVPLAVVGRTQRYSLGKVARLSGLAGVAHVAVSIGLGAVIVAIGLQFRSRLESAQSTIVGLLLIGTGVAFVVVELSGWGHRHAHGHGHPNGRRHDHDHADDHDRADRHGDAGASSPVQSRLRSLAAIMVPFGAAASPDLTILPVFLAATAVGTGTAIGSLAVFATVTIATIVGLTVFATAGGYQVRGQWLDRWGNAVTALVLILIGALVLAGVL